MVVAHEHQRRLRGEEEDRLKHIEKGRLYQGTQPLPAQAVTGLIVVMQKVYEPVGREMAAGFTASGKIMRRPRVALIDKAGCERAAKTV